MTRMMQGKPEEAEADFARCRALGGTLQPSTEQLWREVRQKRAPKYLI